MCTLHFLTVFLGPLFQQICHLLYWTESSVSSFENWMGDFAEVGSLRFRWKHSENNKENDKNF